MGNYVGQIGERIKTQVTLTGDYEYQTRFGWLTQYHHIYTMVDSEEHVLVWRTTSIMGYEADEAWHSINRGDIIKISATVKEHGEYKGQEQTEVQRLKVLERVFKAQTPEERAEAKRLEREAKKQEQLDSIREGDYIWRMPYRQFKEHYADCETVIDSYQKVPRGTDTIEVIIRSDRLKASGVRGKHFSGYCLENEEGKRCTYRAVSEENAIRQALKEFPEHTWECVKIYHYNSY